MSIAVIFTGLACGTLLAAVGLALWGSSRQVPGLSHAVRAIGWLAGALLLIGALLAWQGDHSVSAPALRLILMAALAAPPAMPHRCSSPWSNVMPILPVLILAWVSLFWTARPVAGETGSPPVSAMGLAVVVCGGLGTRALGEALSTIAVQTPHSEWLTTATYALLTLLVGSTALVNLWQRGMVWGETASEGGLAGAWLAWSAAWLSARQRSRLRAGLTVVVASLLVSTALIYS